MENKELVKLAIDAYRGTVTNYTSEQAGEVIVKAIKDILGTDKIDVKSLRRNNNKDKVFSLIETLIPKLTEDGFKDDEFFLNLVEYVNIKEGDLNEFVVDKDSTFIIADTAKGIATPRRQRIGEKTTVTVKTTTKMIRFYEELSRLLAGRVTWGDFVDALVRTYTQNAYNDIYTAFAGIDASTEGMNSTYAPTAGTYDEEALLDIVAHVEASTGKRATIIGTTKALRNCTTANPSNQAKDDYYNIGYYGKLAGIPMIGVKNRHQLGTDTFLLDDKKMWVIASDDKPIKYVTEGEGLIEDKPATDNADLTQEYVYMENTGVGVVLNGKIGVYTLQ